MRTPAEHKVFQWIYWEKKYGKPVFKIFWYGRSDRFYPGNAGDVFLVNLDCVHAWNFSGTCAGADEISRKKAGSPREPDLDGSTSGRHRTAHIYAFEKKKEIDCISHTLHVEFLIFSGHNYEWEKVNDNIMVFCMPEDIIKSDVSNLERDLVCQFMKAVHNCGFTTCDSLLYDALTLFR